MKYICNTILIFILITSVVYSEVKKQSQIEKTPVSTTILNKKFYSKIIKTPHIRRDVYLDKILNSIIQGRGYVESVDNLERYQRKYRIIITDSESMSLKIKLFIFTDNEEYHKILKKGDLFEFHGQFVIYTPISSDRNSYILDVILKEGDIVVK